MSYELAKKYINSIEESKKEIKPRPIMIDCDPGIDDAIALTIIAEYKHLFDIKLITSCAGNTPIDITTRNIQFFANNFFPGVRVAKGSKHPLVKVNASNADDVHGKTGLGNFNIGEQDYPVEADSVLAMRDVLLNSEEKITMVTLGPVTNIAKLLINYPEVKEKIEVIYSMIGSVDGTGNITKYAEFNSYFDPEAFDIVVKSNIPMIINPMQLGNDTVALKETFNNYPTLNRKDDMVKSLINGMNEPIGPEYVRIYDASTAMALVNPELYEYIPCDIEVTTSKGIDGKCVMNRNENGMHKYQVSKDKAKVTEFLFKTLFK